jgi:hypothetical protein
VTQKFVEKDDSSCHPAPLAQRALNRPDSESTLKEARAIYFDHVAVGPLHSVRALLELCGWNVVEVVVKANDVVPCSRTRDPQIAYPNKSRLTAYFGKPFAGDRIEYGGLPVNSSVIK